MYRFDCSSNSYKHTTTPYHIKYDYTNGKNNNDNFLAGMGAAVGKYQFLYEYPLYNKTHTLYGLQPYVGYSNNFINGKVGFIAGNINYADTNKINHLQFSNELELFLHNLSLWQQYCPTTAMLGPPQFSAGIGWRDGKQKSKDFLLALRLGYTKVNKHDALCGWVSCTSNQKYDLSLYGNIHSNRIQGLSTSNVHFGIQLGYKW
nr:hypothetical protein [Bacteroidota bacterium]